MTTVTSIQQVLRPIFIACFVLGLGVYPLKKPNLKIQWIVYLSILYSLTIWSAYVYLIYYLATLFTWKLLYHSILGIVITETNTFITIISVFMGFYHQKRFELCIKKLATIDDTLEELGTPKMYRKMHMRSKEVVIGWIVHNFVINFCDMWWMVTEKTASWGFFLPYILNHCFHINAFIDLVFVFFLWHIGIRLEAINEHMQDLLVKEKHELRCTWKKPVIVFRRYTSYTNNYNNYKRTLWTSMHLYFELCRIARDLNVIFGPQITFEMVSCFTTITSLCHMLCSLLVPLFEYQYEISIYIWFSISCWFLIFLVKLHMVNYICENMKDKANKIDKVIYQLTNIPRYADVRKEIYQFALRAMQNPLKFTGMGLFYFGNNFLRKFYMTIIKFLVIMVQMKMYVIFYISDNTFIEKRKLASHQS